MWAELGFYAGAVYAGMRALLKYSAKGVLVWFVDMVYFGGLWDVGVG